MVKKTNVKTKSKPTSTVSDEDKDLFRAHVKDVKPLKINRAEIHSKPIRPKKITVPVSDSVETTWLNNELEGIAADETLFFCRSGVQKNVLLRLKRGAIQPEAHLDLHGLRRDQAHHVLKRFIDQSLTEGKRFVCVVHGKGFRTNNQVSILKALVNDDLRRNPEVLAFLSAPAQNGGTGAVLVILKRR